MSRIEKSAILLLALGLVAIHVWWSSRLHLLHGDMLYFESFYNDVIIHGRNITQFFFTEVTFFFPDLLIFIMLRPFSADAAWAVMTYALVFGGLYFLLLATIFKRIWGERKSNWHLLLSLLGVVVLTQLTPLSHMVYWPNQHGSIQLIFLFYVWQFMRIPHLPRQTVFLLIASDCLVSALLTFSDMLAVTVLLLPATLIFCHLGFKSGDQNGVWRKFALANALGIAAGYLFKVASIRYGIIIGVPFEISFSEIKNAVYAFPMSLIMMLARSWVLFSIFGIIFVISFYRRPLIHAPKTNFSRFAWCSLILGALAMIFSGRLPSTDRYIPQFYYLPILWIALYGIPRLPLSVRTAKMLLGIGIIFLIVTVSRLDSGITSYPKITACLDEHFADLPTPWGLSGFYTAKLVTFTSSTRLHMNQVKKNLSFDPWMNSFAWLHEDIYGRLISKHTYFVSRDKVQTNRALEIWGQPKNSFTCRVENNDDLQVLIYPDGILPLPPDGTQPN